MPMRFGALRMARFSRLEAAANRTKFYVPEVANDTD